MESFEETIKRAGEVTSEAIAEESRTLAGANASGVLGAFKVMGRAFANVNWLELLIALGTIFIIYGFKRITTVVPSTLVALFVMTGIALGFGLDYRPIQEIPSGLPIPNLGIITEFSLGSITPYIGAIVMLALLGAIDSLLTSIVADNMTKTKHNSNQELIGQGIGNSVAAVFGGIPGAGATIRTVVNINAGGKTKLSGMIAGILLFLILLLLGPTASKIPAAVLAGILITVGIGVMDYKGLKAIPNMPKSEVFVMLIVLVLSSIWDLVPAVGIGLVLSALLYMKHTGDLTAEHSEIKALEDDEAWSDEIDFPENLKEEVFIKHIEGPIFFGSTSEIQSMVSDIPKTAEAVIIRVDKTKYMDQSGLFTMEDILSDLISQGKTVCLVGLKEQPRYMMEKIDIIPDLIEPKHIFKDFKECLVWMNDNVEDVYGPSANAKV